jgi:hypothetical protein
MRRTIGHELVLAARVPFAMLGAYWALADYHSKQDRTQARALQLAHEVSAEVDQQVADPTTRRNSTHHVFVVATPLWDEVGKLQVVEQGPGIPEEEQAVGFERFRHGRCVAGAAGLGPYVAHAYVQAMGGQVGVRSAPRHGATRWVRLPRETVAASAEPFQSAVASSSAVAPGPSPHVPGGDDRRTAGQQRRAPVVRRGGAADSTGGATSDARTATGRSAAAGGGVTA